MLRSVNHYRRQKNKKNYRRHLVWASWPKQAKRFELENVERLEKLEMIGEPILRTQASKMSLISEANASDCNIAYMASRRRGGESK